MQEVQAQYMLRAIQLAKAGSGQVAPNPMVGAVLVYKDKIIGEGYHQQYGKAHAEVNAINHVKKENKHLISNSTLYVTLEPCSHYGKTPPCADLIIKEQIPRVIIGTIDPFPKVSGSGIEKLKRAGIEVITGIKENECVALNKRFLTFYQKKRPYIILKWAQSIDGFIALPGPRSVKISNVLTNRIVHKWRSEEQAILIGSGTALIDDPLLTNRLWTGSSPTRIILDRKDWLPAHLKIFNDQHPAIVYNLNRSAKAQNTEWVKVPSTANFIKEVLKDLYEKKIQSLIVEGGAQILSVFIENKLWDEARVITGNSYLENGLPAPKLSSIPTEKYDIAGDQIQYFKHHP